MPTRLKRLDLHGFKSFATPTTFVFDPGITAVIGPNGSGKSNIADALRWVLGEQSYANLRGRRTEDVIFAGSSARSPIGMAEVALTLDNESGDLPLPFAEVTITRRAYRSGENQYLINGARVRLKDVAQVTASLGQAYTVIGQGLVDAVLSQRPEERRGLFEHAAGITGLRLKHAEAERNLSETQSNSMRLEDLLAEVEPRLRGLERAARQAREHGQVRGQLQVALRRLYAQHLWHADARAVEAAVHAAAAEHGVADLVLERDAAIEDARLAAAEARDTRAASEALARQLEQLRMSRREAEHRLALANERTTAQHARRSDLRRRRDELEASGCGLDAEFARCDAALATLADELATARVELEHLEEHDADARRQRAAAAASVRTAEATIATLERELFALESRRDVLAQRAHDAAVEISRLAGTAQDRRARLDDLARQHDALTAALPAARTQLETNLTQQEALRASRGQVQVARRQAAEALQALERRLVERSTRLETLGRLRDSGVGLQGGTRAVLDAARHGKLDGVVGALASLVQVPVELEAAVEAALGGHLQDIVVERWADAEAAIEHLKRSQTGRATFQPLDSLREVAPRQTHRPAQPGVRGVAADLIDHDPRVAPVVAGLLGRVLVVEDLPTTRATLPTLPSGWSIVTLAGEITRSSGAVTGGARVRESGTLARERELRELPIQCRSLEQKVASAREALYAVERDSADVETRLAALERDVTAARETVRDVETRRERVERWRAETGRALEEDQARIQDLEGRRAAAAGEGASLAAAGDAARMTLAEARAACERTARRVEELDDDGSARRLLEARATLSGLRERQRATTQERARLETQHAALARDSANLDRLTDETEQEISTVERVIADLTGEAELANARLEEAAEREGPLLESVARSEQREREASARQSVVAARLREVERERDHLALELARRGDEVDLLRERAGRDLEVPAYDLAGLLPAAVEADDVERLQREVDRLRERLRRVGTVGDDAIAQYEREAQRHAFLRGQLDDVLSAGDALRSLLGELERAMAAEFDRTFGEVAAAFETTFTSLFGGGRARLVRASDDGSVGVDILAQPPGKRLQSLALLSGGERALTAVALLFAILKVNPSPFCLLDEVDAALDEANVVRVRDELRGLAEGTQFVVVTHNRATIEGSDTLYGVTMGADGVSRVLSLRLPETARA